MRTLVSDLRDVQLTMGCVPAPDASSHGTLGPSGELRVGPLQFPAFAAVASSSPGPALAAPSAAAAAAAAATRGSIGAWDFSMPARASPGESGRAAAGPGPGPAAGGRRVGDMDAAELVRQLQPTDATGSEGEEEPYEEDEEDEQAAAARARPKT